MELKPPHILAISSFAVHGTASLKTFIAFLGEKVLPVPSLMLNGLTNMALVKKFETPFRELLQGTFELVVNRDLELILYIGYLGNAEQANVIMEMIDTYRGHIKMIITDPVCGDHGRTYVPNDVIEQWPKLIDKSAIVFPNLTELKILTGHKPDDNQALEIYADAFKQSFPKVQLVVTSLKADNKIGIQSFGDESFSYYHPELSKNYGGSGDAFLALFIRNHFYRHLPFNDALETAAKQTFQLIKNSITKNSDDLVLEIPDNKNFIKI
jgi:pyridoxine kinase